ncbi:MAG TPA: hypothetical protein VFR58_07445 [Flavisolibacter sp.]|nr:hypothetical protein [Flavisolibacter sp.]
MKHIYLLMMMVFLGTATQAQDSWKVRLGWSQVLNTAQEDTARNVIVLDADRRIRPLTLVYLERTTGPGWERFLAVFDENDREVLQQKGKQLRISRSGLSDLLKSSSTLKIYTWALPIDPEIRATIRVRRVHLCTIRLKS